MIHVPAIFYGWHIKKRRSYAKSQLLSLSSNDCTENKVSLPNGAQVLEEIYKILFIEQKRCIFNTPFFLLYFSNNWKRNLIFK
jgi:hypothetical protein